MIILYGWIDALDLDLPGSAASASSASIHLKSLSILAFLKVIPVLLKMVASVRSIDPAIRSGSILRLA